MGGGLLLVCCRPSPPRWFDLGDDAPPLLLPHCCLHSPPVLAEPAPALLSCGVGGGLARMFPAGSSFCDESAGELPHLRLLVCPIVACTRCSYFRSLAREITRTARGRRRGRTTAHSQPFSVVFTRQNHPAQCCTSLPAVLPCRSFAPSSPALAVRVSARPRGKSHEQHACDDGGGITA